MVIIDNKKDREEKRKSAEVGKSLKTADFFEFKEYP